MRYDAIFFDADETLFDFQEAQRFALANACGRFQIPFDEVLLKTYHLINARLWRQYERGEIGQRELRVLRFEKLFSSIRNAGFPGGAPFNSAYTDALGQCSDLLPGALELVRTLSPHFPLYIVTNGSSKTQHPRLANSKIAPYINGMFISEEIGAQKPDPAFFDAVFSRFHGLERGRVLLLGDSLTSDMRGGRLAGLTTCWLNASGGTPNRDCDFVVDSLPAFLSVAMK